MKNILLGVLGLILIFGVAFVNNIEEVKYKYYVVYSDKDDVTGSVEVTTEKPITEFGDIRNIRDVIQKDTAFHLPVNVIITNIIPIPIK